jgi:hypothetical protein
LKGSAAFLAETTALPSTCKMGVQSRSRTKIIKLLPEHLNVGENRIEVRVAHRQPYPLCTNLTVEKLEVQVAYQ